MEFIGTFRKNYTLLAKKFEKNTEKASQGHQKYFVTKIDKKQKDIIQKWHAD